MDQRLGYLWWLLLISTVLWVPESHSRNLDLPRYETAYACEGKTLKIECGDGERIHLIRANYGRFSITICNDHGNTEWSVNCMSHKSLRVLHNRCETLQKCVVDVNNTVFEEDPCVGSFKYVEIHYICQLASTTTTTSRPSPPWLITSQPPSVWSTVRPPTVRPPTPPVTDVVQPPTSGRTTGRTTSHQTLVNVSVTPAPLPPLQPDIPDLEDDISPDKDEDFTRELGSSNKLQPTSTSPSTAAIRTTPSTLVEVSVPPQYVPSPSVTLLTENDSCSPVTTRNLHWNWTRVGDRVVQPCPGGATGLARWRCMMSIHNSEPEWYPDTPDLSECRSVWLTSLESRIIEGDSLIAITSDLAQVTSSKTLYGGDMMITTKIIMKMAQKMANNIQSFADPRQREEIVSELLNNVVKTGSNLLDFTQHPSWKDLGYKEQMRVATSLLIGLEENAFLLADTVIREKTVIQTVKNIMLSVRVLETHNIGTETFPSSSTANEAWPVSNDWVQLPRSALRENSEGGLVRLVFVAFDRLEEILAWKPESYDQPGGISQQPNVSRVLNSKVISASLGKGRHIQLSEPIRLSMRHLKTENVSNPSCVFWDYTMSAWSEEGCRVESTNRTHTMCLCDHLTNFAILMDVHMTYLPPGHQMALQIVTYIGCAISIICLILAIITFHLFRGLKSDRTTIHKNLCFCLLVAEVLFVAGIGQTEHAIICSIIAGLLHFFFLCAFAWMFLEGFQLYVMLIEVFEAEKSRARWYYLAAYGIPLIIVCAAAVIDPLSYGTEQYCWLRADNFFIFTFVGPVILVILANLIFLSMAIFIMCRHANASISMKSKEHSRLASARIWLRGAIVLVFLLGLTWTFGLLYLNEETVFMAYIFTILNSLQGLFIFMFHCLQNEKVRKEYRKLIRRHSWLPRCLRCSKPGSGSSSSSGGGGGGGSGGRGHGTSTTTGKERRGSLYAANGSPPTHSTDSSALSPHTTSNISFKSYSRDSGHGGSEQEDSPRSYNVGANSNGGGGAGPTGNIQRLNNAKDSHRKPFMATAADFHQCNVSDPQQFVEYLHGTENFTHQQQLAELSKQIQQLPQNLRHNHSHTAGRKKQNFFRTASPWNHTYTEIHDARMAAAVQAMHGVGQDDPVYEEIDRNEVQVSDMSDEDARRQSDMSRQSSRSYGDHRPLIPYSPAAERSCLDDKQRFDAYRLPPPRHAMYGGGDNARSLAAVLDGETVVCHLEPPELYAGDSYSSRTMVLPPYAEC